MHATDTMTAERLQQQGWEESGRDGGYASLIGPFWRRKSGDTYEYGMLTTSAHANIHGIVHGGALLSFADHVLGYTALDLHDTAPKVTIQLDLKFIAAAKPGDFLTGTADVEKSTRSLLFMRGDLYVGPRLIASASGIWKKLGTSWQAP